jgi:ribosome-associated translation inhibitor RaiA
VRDGVRRQYRPFTVSRLHGSQTNAYADLGVGEQGMKIQFNTSAHVYGNAALAAWVGATIERALKRFSEHVTRVEVHFDDENGGKGGLRVMRCMLEARVEGRQPVAVTEHADTLEKAVQGACDKLVHLLDSTLGRLHDHRDRSPGLPVEGTEPAPG